MKTKKGEKEKLRTVILERSLDYLKRHGRVGAGTHAMMRFAGLTRGALYSHFKSKDDLFAEAIRFDLKNLEESLAMRFRKEGKNALATIISEHLSEKSMKDVGASCVFTSLSSDMQRCKASDRATFESYLLKIFSLFADALQEQFPNQSPEECHRQATNLYAGLVGTLAVARTMKDRNHATGILDAGRKYLTATFVADR